MLRPNPISSLVYDLGFERDRYLVSVRASMIASITVFTVICANSDCTVTYVHVIPFVVDRILESLLHQYLCGSMGTGGVI